ncbi:glycosyltransferase family 2 protein [Candidatus Magnetominusculus xianensis]|uniref:Glycosyl transferase family protein n=1 Tax=Candidatus Magnetominusculus xianensis TaxID=1748249 RepID=A0ABR5SF00_9BACT|nr:glycosyltransferase family 2 protein [Candidatus Magnetominusculus xianensis]KWT85301.1 glycosyl transferase family protein [Candidatus Magnetominusculus xianensis]MBF0404812.1 glycosyltransferase family 2 protein [Nitrospirota bacterium]
MEKFDRSVSMLSWAYNEEESIEEFLKRAYDLMEQTVEDFELILIDDCSTDRTYELAETFMKTHVKFRLYRNEKNLDVGLSLQRAVKSASKEFLFWQTVDWSYNIGDLRKHLELLKTFDIVQGVRGNTILIGRSDNLKKSIVSIVNYLIIRLLFKVPLSDYQNVTFYPTKWIQSITYESKSGFSNPEGLIKSSWCGKSIREVLIGFINRKLGAAKGTRPKSVKASVIDIFRLWFKWIVLNKRVFTKNGAIERYK